MAVDPVDQVLWVDFTLVRRGCRNNEFLLKVSVSPFKFFVQSREVQVSLFGDHLLVDCEELIQVMSESEPQNTFFK